MSTEGTGPQPGLYPQQFMSLKAPTHLPTLVSTRGEDTPYLPTSHHVSAITVPGITDVQPSRVGYDLGSQEEFSYTPNTNEILVSATLCCELSPLAAQGGGTEPCYIDDPLCGMMERCEWLYGTMNPLQVLRGDDIHFSTLQETKDEELERKYQLQAAGLTRDERVALATDHQFVYLELPFFWANPKAGRWHAYAYGRPTRIRITWRTPNFVVQQKNGTIPIPTVGPNYILQKWIRFHTIIPTEATKQVYMKKIEAQGDHGQLTLFKDIQSQNFTISAATTHTEVKLDMFNKYGYDLKFRLQRESDLAANPCQADGNGNNRWALLDITHLQFNIANKIYWPRTDDWYHKHVLQAKWFLGNHELPLYNIPFTEYPDLHTEALGGLEFSNVINPVLVLDHVAPGVNVTLICDLYCHNYIRQVLRGVQSAMETVQPL